MSRVGKHPVSIPAGVECQIAGGIVSVKGQKGSLSWPISPEVNVVLEDGALKVSPISHSKKSRMMWGTSRRLLNNIVVGVSQGFTKRLELNGVGYRAAMDQNTLVLQLGYSHEIRYNMPEGIQIVCEKPTAISVSGFDKQKVGQVAAEIRSFRGPEPYKGKGVKYADEIILRKEGKKK